ncbi:MAG: thymidine phosphorylase [Pseudomonadota bacterium]
MDARTIIEGLRDGKGASRESLQWFADALSDGRVSDAQAGAFAMAIVLRGLDPDTRAALTLAMRDSGETLTWDLDGPVIDKHSTGGVGDCVSLVLAPALAACGGYVPMISGRGLGHTGGTLDKLEAIPGLRTDLSEAQLRRVVGQAGCVIASASDRIAPADRRLYAIRDVTATVQSLDLITASILSKKLAAGLEGLILDVKVGSGAFMKDLPAARELARALVDTGNAAGCPTSAVISDMNQPLAPALGNGLEVAEALRVLTAEAPDSPLELIAAALGGLALFHAGLARDIEAGAAQITTAVRDGHAAERFGRMIAAMGGPVQFMDKQARFLPEANVIREFVAIRSGYISAIDGEAMGHAVIALRGGRRVETDVIDPSVGLSSIVSLGQHVTAGQPLLYIHAGRSEHADHAADVLATAIRISDEPADIPPLIHERIF